MNKMNKTDECIKMLEDLIFKVKFFGLKCDTLFDENGKRVSLLDENGKFNSKIYKDENIKFENIFNIEEFIFNQNVIIEMFRYRLFPEYNITIPDEATKDEIIKANFHKSNFDAFWYVWKNYPLVTTDDLKNEFWENIGGLENITRLPNLLKVIEVKFKDICGEMKIDISSIEESLLKLLSFGRILKSDADEILQNLILIEHEFNFRMYLIKGVYKQFKEMAEPLNLQNEPQPKPENDNQEEFLTQNGISYTYNKNKVDSIYSFCIEAETKVFNETDLPNDIFLTAVRTANFNEVFQKVQKTTKFKYIVYVLSKCIDTEKYKEWYLKAAHSIKIEPNRCSGANVPIDWKIEVDAIK